MPPLKPNTRTIRLLLLVAIEVGDLLATPAARAWLTAPLRAHETSP